MTRFRTLLPILGICLTLIVLPGCEKNYVKPKPAQPISPAPPPGNNNPAPTVFFKTNIVPLLDAKGCKNCHNGGSLANGLDLTPDNEYASLTEKGMLNTAAPSSSKFYQALLEGGQPASHPAKLPASDSEKILTWIKEGAKNN